MIYDKEHSALRKVISDCIFLLLVIALLLSATISVSTRSTNGQLQEISYIFIAATLAIVTLLLSFAFFQKLVRLRNFRSNWRIQLSSSSIRLDTPDDQEEKKFEYDLKNIKRFAREAYEDDGVWYKWYMYVDDIEGTPKQEFNLGPFSIEKVMALIQKSSGADIEVVEIDLNGNSSPWVYSFRYKLNSLFRSILAALILASFIVPSVFYIVRFISR